MCFMTTDLYQTYWLIHLHAKCILIPQINFIQECHNLETGYSKSTHASYIPPHLILYAHLRTFDYRRTSRSKRSIKKKKKHQTPEGLHRTSWNSLRNLHGPCGHWLWARGLIKSETLSFSDASIVLSGIVETLHQPWRGHVDFWSNAISLLASFVSFDEWCDSCNAG